ncbi:MAG TPA: RDD family protein [Actinomycetota bacterium]|nr:RDD family protein [Actinomycetota bacterium]
MAGAVVPSGMAAPRYAGWWRRVGAWLIDWCIFLVPSLLLSIPFILEIFEQIANAQSGPVGVEEIGTAPLALLMVGSLILNVGFIAYEIIMNGGPRGQTVGKMALSIQVRDADNFGPIGYGKAAVRYFVGYALVAACWIPGIVDCLFPLWDEKKQTIHDKAANSVVLDVRR